MVLGLLAGAVLSFAFVALASYAGTLRALEVYHDPHQDSAFLSQGARRRRIRTEEE